MKENLNFVKTLQSVFLWHVYIQNYNWNRDNWKLLCVFNAFINNIFGLSYGLFPVATPNWALIQIIYLKLDFNIFHVNKLVIRNNYKRFIFVFWLWLVHTLNSNWRLKTSHSITAANYFQTWINLLARIISPLTIL